MLQHRAEKKLRKVVESEVFFPFLPRHREHFMFALCNLFQYNDFQIIYLCIWVFCWYSFFGKESRWFLLSIRFQTIIVSTNIM